MDTIPGTISAEEGGSFVFQARYRPITHRKAHLHEQVVSSLAYCQQNLLFPSDPPLHKAALIAAKTHS